MKLYNALKVKQSPNQKKQNTKNVMNDHIPCTLVGMQA